MHAKSRAATGAAPFGFILLDKCGKPFGFYAQQVLDHAHTVFRAVPFIESNKPLAREARTGETEITAGPAPFFTRLDPAQDSRLRLAAVIAPAPRAWIPAAQERAAQAAVHAAGGDEQNSVRLLVVCSTGHCREAVLPRG